MEEQQPITNTNEPAPATEQPVRVRVKRTLQASNFYLFINTKKKYEHGSREAREAARRLCAILESVYGTHRYIEFDSSYENCTRNDVDWYVEQNGIGELCAIVAIWIRARNGVRYLHRDASMEIKNKLENPYAYIDKGRITEIVDIPELARRYKLPPPPATQ